MLRRLHRASPTLDVPDAAKNDANASVEIFSGRFRDWLLNEHAFRKPTFMRER
jgi:hypothetical protein